MTRPDHSPTKQQFEEQGFIGPIPLLSADQCSLLFSRLSKQKSPEHWKKDLALKSQDVCQLAFDPLIVDRVRELIGDDILLWGANLVRRRPGQKHHWHTDIETAATEGDAVTVWIGLNQVTRRSGLKLVSHSHHVGKPIQQLIYEKGWSRESVTDQQVLSAARLSNSRAKLLQPIIAVGEALFFDGRIWHSSENRKLFHTRTALILQYISESRPVYLYDDTRLTWPFRYLKEQPLCLSVGGLNASKANRTQTDTRMKSMPRVKPSIYRLPTPVAEDRESGWHCLPFFKGSTRNLKSQACHASVLSPGKEPHPPHQHEEEELLIMLEGGAELHYEGASGKLITRNLKPCEFAYFPRNCKHTLRNNTDRPNLYMMYKWTGGSRVHSKIAEPLTPQVHHFNFSAKGSDSSYRNILDGPTEHLAKLQCHVTTLATGDGYHAHSDDHDVGILVLDGRIEILGEKMEPYDFTYYPAGYLHDMNNIGDKPARYLVFEFHRTLRTQKPTGIKRWVRKLGRLLTRSHV